MQESFSATIRDAFSLSTWLSAAALCQCLILKLAPFNLAIIPSLLVVGGRLAYTILAWLGLIDAGSLNGVRPGRWTTKIPSADGRFSEKPSSDQVTVLVLSARFHHPAGVFAPHALEVINNMNHLLAELEANPTKWGFLARTPTLSSTEAASGNTVVWLLYWKTLADLHNFANNSRHTDVVKAYQGKAKGDKYHIGISHEVYDIPAGHWENICLNMRPFGLGSTIFPINSNEGSIAMQSRSIIGLQPAKGATWRSMLSRFGRNDETGKLGEYS